MAKYTVTRACGHDEVIQLFGKVRDREWRIENVEEHKLCYDCYQAEREKQNAKAAAEAVEIGLPELTGSEKQIGWAETIRLGAVERFDAFLVRLKEEGKRAKQDVSEQGDLAREIMEHILATRTRASWWIDNRDVSTSDLALQLLLEKNIESTKKAKAEAAPAAIEAKAEATVRPENTVTETVAEIRITETSIEINFPERRDDFRDVVRERLDFRWSYENSCWQRLISFRLGNPADRVAEAGHLLLAAGIPIRIYNPDVRKKAIAGDYESECRRWITAFVKGDHEGWFAISWDRRVDDFYHAARKLRGSKWLKPVAAMPPEQFEAVLDFAEQYEFKLSRGAQQIVDAAQRVKDAAIIADVTAPGAPEGVVTGKKPPKLETPEKVNVDETLRDDN